MVLFKYGFKRKYVGFHESFFAKVCVYNLLQHFHGIRWPMTFHMCQDRKQPNVSHGA